ncbi:MAG: O-antigen polysaccharide polymerase Wzy [Steroidobacteraceae bacterium]
MLLLTVGAVLGSASNIHIVYLALLFAVCTTPIFNSTAFNDRYALLVIFSAIYFQFFGTLDLITLFRGIGETAGFISKSEVVILIGGVLTQVFYRVVARNPVELRAAPRKDWPERTLLIVGLSIWIVATVLTWQFKVNIITGANAAAVTRGLESITALQTIGYLLANMMQPLGILIIAYSQCRYQRWYLLPLLAITVVVQLMLGFVTDTKGEALIGAVLVVVTRLLVNGKIPKGWILTIVIFIALAFPALQANRAIRGQDRLDSTDVAANIVGMIQKTFAKAEEVTTGTTRAQTVFERMSLKGSVEMIVTRTGVDVPFQHGHTLSPLYAAFIPKIIWRDKPDVQTGQLVNKEFKLSVHTFTYISPSHLGEMYWNYGWPGALIGMSLLGCVLGFIGRAIDMVDGASITQLMIAAITVRQMLLGFESTIAACYVVWLRSAAFILLLHWLLARVVRSTGSPASEATKPTIPIPCARSNLMR